jgi:hypothetical protein
MDPNRHVTLSEPSTERTPLVANNGKEGDYDDYDSEQDGSDYFDAVSGREFSAARREWMAADRLSERLLEIDDDDDEMEDLILHETLNVDMDMPLLTLTERGRLLATTKDGIGAAAATTPTTIDWKDMRGRLCSMTSLLVLAFGAICSALWIGAEFIGPPNQPVGPYQLIERQVRDVLFIVMERLLVCCCRS